MILVTGGAGFIGSHLVDRLLSQKIPVRVLERSRRVLATGEGLGRALDGVETVIHLAGATKPLTPDGYRSGNVTATENLARAVAAAKRPIRVVHVSSLAAAGPTPSATPIAEDAEPHPVSEYGRSKLDGERRMREVLPEAVVVRPPVVYGPKDTDVFQILKSVSQGFVLQIAGGERYFSAIYVSDLVDGILAAATESAAIGGTYFLAHPYEVSFSEMIGIAAKALGRSPRMVTIPASAAYAAGYCAEAWSRLTRKPGILSRDKVSEMVCSRWTCSAERAKRELGFEARTDIRAGIESSIAWYRTAGWIR